MNSLKGKTVVITGGSRGIGQAIALRFAKAGANILVVSKDSPENMETVADQIRAVKGQALVLSVDITDHLAIKQAIAQGVSQFGGIDVLINNTSAACFSDAIHMSPEEFDLVMATSVRAAFFMSQACLPYLKLASNPHLINISPPMTMDPYWFKDHLIFSVAKYAMSMCTLGMAAEFAQVGIAVNSLWPKSTIATQSIKDHFSSKVYAGSRWPSIMGDAAYELAMRPSRECTGQFFTDEALLREAGIMDFSHYAVDPASPLMKALFIQDEQLTLVSRDLFLKK